MGLFFLDILVLFGVVLSFFLVVLLFSSKSFRSDVHQYFALTIISLNCWLTYTYFEDFVPANGVLEIISWDFLFPFSFMMYILKAVKDPLGEQKRIWLLALPCLLLTAVQSFSFFFDFDPFDWLANGDEEKMWMWIEMRAFSFLPYSIVLIGFSYLKVSKAKQLDKDEKWWLKFNSLFLVVFVLSWIFGDPIDFLFDIAIWPYILYGLAMFLIVVTYLGIHHLNISEQRRQIRGLQIAVEAVPPQEMERAASLTEEETSPSSPKTNKKIQMLDTLMVDNQLYLQQSLSRRMLADQLGISEGYLSELLKTELQTNFNDYINAFRVRRAMKMLGDEQFDLFSIEAIGYEAGFKTKSVFYTAFKRWTQKTPGSYRKALKSS
ncbi:MAG: helix-turn-helix domain-containing protein [Bacteroidota bacterium]